MCKDEGRRAPTLAELQDEFRHEATALALALKHHQRRRWAWWTRPRDTSVYAEVHVDGTDYDINCWKVTDAVEKLYVDVKGQTYRPVRHRTDVGGIFLDPLDPSDLNFMELENLLQALRIMRYRLGK
jgi:hypothetical protein